jgi:hypothetical protein
MIKFGVLRADADEISLKTLHFAEVRQDQLCWRSSGPSLALFARPSIRHALAAEDGSICLPWELGS